VVAVQVTYLRSPYRLIERLPGQKELEYQFRNWYHFNWLSGDDLLQSLVHSLDKGSWALGDQPPVRAFGVGGRSSSCDKPFILRRRLRPQLGDLGVTPTACACTAWPRPERLLQRRLLRDHGHQGLATRERQDRRRREVAVRRPQVQHVRRRASLPVQLGPRRRPINNHKYMINSTMMGCSAAWPPSPGARSPGTTR